MWVIYFVREWVFNVLACDSISYSFLCLLIISYLVSFFYVVDKKGRVLHFLWFFFSFFSFLSLNFFFYLLLVELATMVLAIMIFVDPAVNWSLKKKVLSYMMVFSALGVSLGFIYSCSLVSCLDFYRIGEGRLLYFSLVFFLFLKAPIFPFHVWLPLVHVRVNTAVSIILSSVVLKYPVYAWIRFSPLISQEIEGGRRILFFCILVSVLVSVIVASMEQNLKRIIAYSSISHMNVSLFLMLFGGDGLFYVGVKSILVHGYVTIALFSMAHIFCEYTGTMKCNLGKDIVSHNPVFVLFSLILVFMNFGFPVGPLFFVEICFINLLGDIGWWSYLYLLIVGIFNIITLMVVVSGFIGSSFGVRRYSVGCIENKEVRLYLFYSIIFFLMVSVLFIIRNEVW
uniref:NADH dehydrogenase subunit 4 n=1 Tax=Polypodium hydriforme TaxID=43186 RepID=UPI00211599C7